MHKITEYTNKKAAVVLSKSRPGNNKQFLIAYCMSGSANTGN